MKSVGEPTRHVSITRDHVAHVISCAPPRRKFFHVKYSNVHNIVKYGPIELQFSWKDSSLKDSYLRTTFGAMRHIWHNAPFSPPLLKRP